MDNPNQALLDAAYLWDPEGIAEALANGADVNAVGFPTMYEGKANGMTALHALFDMQIAHDVTRNYLDSTLLDSRTECLNLLLSQPNIDVNAWEVTPWAMPDLARALAEFTGLDEYEVAETSIVYKYKTPLAKAITEISVLQSGLDESEWSDARGVMSHVKRDFQRLFLDPRTDVNVCENNQSGPLPHYSSAFEKMQFNKNLPPPWLLEMMIANPKLAFAEGHFEMMLAVDSWSEDYHNAVERGVQQRSLAELMGKQSKPHHRVRPSNSEDRQR